MQTPETNNTQQAERLYRCSSDVPGCGQSKPISAFHKDSPALCIECANKIAEYYCVDTEFATLIANGYESTRQIFRAAKPLATKEAYDKGLDILIAGKGLEKGRRRFISETIRGAVESPLDHEFFQKLLYAYKGWIFGHFGIDSSQFQNLPKNGLLDGIMGGKK